MEETREEKSLEGAVSPSSVQLKQIRTFQGDVAQALGRQKESLVSIQQTQQERNRLGVADSYDLESAGRKNNFFFLLIGGLFFILLGGIGAWYGYGEYLDKTAPPEILAPANRFIFPENEINLDVTDATRDSLIAAFEEAVADISAGELRQVVVRSGSAKEAPLTETADFLTILESRAPGSLVRALDPLFMLGSIGHSDQSTGSSRFIIFKLSSFANAFPGMLAWESEIVDDLGPLLGKVALMKANDPISVFKDMVVRNKDVRVQDALLYSFFDNNMLIITDRIETLETLIERLTREKLSR